MADDGAHNKVYVTGEGFPEKVRYKLRLEE